MKKQLIKALSLLLVCVCVIGLSTPAAAASTVSSKSYTGSSRGGTSSYIYVKTNSKSATKSVKLTCNKGILLSHYLMTNISAKMNSIVYDSLCPGVTPGLLLF